MHAVYFSLLTFLQASYPLVVSTQVMSGDGDDDIPVVCSALLTFLQASYPLVVSTQVMQVMVMMIYLLCALPS